MSIYGDLSKPQRAFLHELLEHSAVSIDTAHSCRRDRRMLNKLSERGFIEWDDHSQWYMSSMYCAARAWLTVNGLAMLRSRDFRHARRRTVPSRP